jgi:carbon storage regulator
VVVVTRARWIVFTGQNHAKDRSRGTEARGKEAEMLVLSRKKMERIIIGEGADAIVVTLVEIRGDKARIAIEAPKRMPVHRDEVYEEIHGEGSVTALTEAIKRGKKS